MDNQPNRKTSSSGNQQCNPLGDQQNRIRTSSSEERDIAKEKNKFKNPEFVLPLPQTEDWARRRLQCDKKYCKIAILDAEQYMHLLLQLDELWLVERAEKAKLKKANYELGKEATALKSKLANFEENNAHPGKLMEGLRRRDEQIENLKRELQKSAEEFEKKKREYRQQVERYIELDVGVDQLVKERDQARNESAKTLQELEEARNQLKRERDEALEVIGQKEREIEDLHAELATRDQLCKEQMRQLSSVLKRSSSREPEQPPKKAMLEPKSDAASSSMINHDDDIVFVNSFGRSDQKQKGAKQESIKPDPVESAQASAPKNASGLPPLGSSSSSSSAVQQSHPSVPTPTIDSSKFRHIVHISQNPPSVPVGRPQQPPPPERQPAHKGSMQLISEFRFQLHQEVVAFSNGWSNAEAFTERFVMSYPPCNALPTENRRKVRDNLLNYAEKFVNFVRQHHTAPPQ